MIVKDDVTIAPLVKRIFRETYGFDDDEFYRNAEVHERIRNAVGNLRESYCKPFCDTDYGDDENRKAYMIAYYPYYIEPARYVVKNFVAPKILPREIIKADFFASGPCPELLGTVAALKKTERCIQVNVQTYDPQPGWFPYQQTTFKLAEKFLKISAPAVILAHAEGRIATDIFFLQNYLSHMPCQNTDKFLKDFSAVAARTNSKTFFVFVDLNYGSTATVFRKLVDENFLRANGLEKIAAHISDYGEPFMIRYGDTTQALRDNIFTDEDGLIQKKNTRFYFVALKKT